MGKKENSKIKAIIFDMNGVLALGIELKRGTASSKGFHSFMANKLNLGLDTWFDAIDTVYADSIEGKVSEKKTLSTISKNLSLVPKRLEKVIIKGYRKLFTENKELYKYAYRLKKRGYKIAILSDQWVFSKKALINEKLLKKFNAVVVSSDIGIRKPNPEIYKLTLKKLGVNPEESIFIDNRKWNLKPAKKLGMKTILFKNNKQAIRETERLLK